MHTHTEKTCFVFSYCCGKGRCNTKYSKLLDLSSSDYTPVQGSFGPHYTHQCATYKNATICSLILLNGMQMIKRTVVLEKKKKTSVPTFCTAVAKATTHSNTECCYSCEICLELNRGQSIAAAIHIPRHDCAMFQTGSLWLHAQYRVALELRDLYI